MSKVLTLVAHPDDEVLGCGATLIKHIDNGDEVRVICLTDGESSRGELNVQTRLEQFHQAMDFLGIKDFSILNFKDQRLDSYPLQEIVLKVEEIKKIFKPNIIYTHSRVDLNQDHKLTNQIALTVFRPTPQESVSKILSFEIPSSTGWDTQEKNFTPNYYSSCSEAQIAKKIQALSLYKSELRDYPHPRSAKALWSLSQFRGSSVGVDYAEAFYIERIIEHRGN